MDKFLFIVFSFFVTSIAVGQEVSSKTPGTVTIELNSGDTLNGFGRINSSNSIIYRKTKDSKKEIYTYKQVKKYTTYYEDGNSEYVYKIIEGSGGVNSIRLLKIIKRGKVDLFSETITTSGFVVPNGMPGDMMMGSYSTSRTVYYIANGGENVVAKLGSGNTYTNRFKRKAKKYFGSCPELIEKINTKFFKRRSLKKIIDYFNENCN